VTATADLKRIAQLLQLHRLPWPRARAKVLLHIQRAAVEGTQQLSYAATRAVQALRKPGTVDAIRQNAFLHLLPPAYQLEY